MTVALAIRGEKADRKTKCDHDRTRRISNAGYERSGCLRSLRFAARLFSGKVGILGNPACLGQCFLSAMRTPTLYALLSWRSISVLRNGGDLKAGSLPGLMVFYPL